MLFDFLPEWARFLVQGVVIFVLLASSAIILGRAGRSPYWAVLIALPYVQIVALWVFAFTVWPKRKK